MCLFYGVRSHSLQGTLLQTAFNLFLHLLHRDFIYIVYFICIDYSINFVYCRYCADPSGRAVSGVGLRPLDY